MSKAQEVNFSPENMHALLAPPSTPVSPASTSTHIDVQLRGIIYSSSKEQSRALIQTEADKVKPFAIDSQLANGARVLQIKPRSVIYEHQGQQREVSLPIRP